MREFLTEVESANPGVTVPAEVISESFNKAITAFDDAIAHDVLDLFGGSVDQLDHYTDSQIREIINDQHKGAVNWQKARLCMYGTTALVALVDPEHRNLWIANLGDCEACEYIFIFLLARFLRASLQLNLRRTNISLLSI